MGIVEPVRRTAGPRHRGQRGADLRRRHYRARLLRPRAAQPPPHHQLAQGPERAAERVGYEAVLALADIKTTLSAYPEDEYGYRRRCWYDDEEEEDDDSGGRTGTAGRKFDIQELVDSEVALTHWTGPDGRRLEQTSLAVSDGEVCASTENGDLVHYSSEYEGYMGNWGNTLDRWYHRAAVVVWPRAQAFANRAETSPSWALDQLAAMAAAAT